MAGINTILNDPSQAVSILAQTLPGSATFFLTLLLVNGLTGSAGGILQIARLVIYYVKEILLGGNPRSLWKVRYTMPTIKYGQVFPPQLLLVSIALGYSTIAPFVCGFALIAFTLYWFVWKYLSECRRALASCAWTLADHDNSTSALGPRRAFRSGDCWSALPDGN